MTNSEEIIKTIKKEGNRNRIYTGLILLVIMNMVGGKFNIPEWTIGYNFWTKLVFAGLFILSLF
jgi:hypothetical protein